MSKLVTIESCARQLVESPDGDESSSLIAEIKRMAARLPPEMTGLVNMLSGDDVAGVGAQIVSLASHWQEIYRPQMEQMLGRQNNG